MDVRRGLHLARFEFDDAFTNGQDGRLGSIKHMQFMEDIADMIFDRLFTEIQDVRNLLIGFSISH